MTQVSLYNQNNFICTGQNNMTHTMVRMAIQGWYNQLGGSFNH